MPADPSSSRALLAALFAEAVAAAHPARFLPALLPPVPPSGRIVLLGAGKAGASAAAVAEAHYLAAGLAPDRLQGLAVTRHGYGAPTRIVEVVEAGHPVPDAAGIAATERVLAAAESAGPDDLVLVLLSGGGSANWIAPAPGVALADKQALTKALLRSGATIHEINTVRRHLSRIKGGRLARLARPARLVTIAISDIPGDDPVALASGPTVGDPTTLAEARAVLARYAISPPPAITAALNDPANETVKPDDPALDGTVYHIGVRPSDALAAAAAAAEKAGYEPILLGADLEGEAREVAAAQAARAVAEKRAGRRVALLSGGELTVTLRGSGRGGPNQEFALALAIALAGEPGIAAVAGDTDGTDGGAGSATDPAGAFVMPDTLARARSRGLDPAARLADNDSTGFFEALGDLLAPGPTFTNVNDFRAILVDP